MVSCDWPDDFSDAAARGHWERALDEARGGQQQPGPLRVAYYAAHLDPGGGARTLVHLATAATARGATVEVLLRRAGDAANGHFAKTLRDRAIPCRIVPPPVPPQALRRGDLLAHLPGRLATAVGRIASCLAGSPSTMLHCFHGITCVLGGLAGFVAGARGTILSVPGPPPAEARHQWRRPWYRLLARSAGVALVTDCRASAQAHAAWLEIPEASILRLPPLFDGSKFARPSVEEQLSFRDGLGVPRGAPLIVGGFRLLPVKQPEAFLAVMAALREFLPDVNAVIAGAGELEPELRARIAGLGLDGAVKLLGARSDVERVLGSGDLCLHTSTGEGVPLILIEAQALGVPVVATSVGGVPETVLEDLSALLCPVGDAKALAKSCARLLRDPALRARMGQAGRAHVGARFEAATVLPRWWALYEQLSGDPRWAGG